MCPEKELIIMCILTHPGQTQSGHYPGGRRALLFARQDYSVFPTQRPLSEDKSSGNAFRRNVQKLPENRSHQEGMLCCWEVLLCSMESAVQLQKGLPCRTASPPPPGIADTGADHLRGARPGHWGAQNTCLAPLSRCQEQSHLDNHRCFQTSSSVPWGQDHS